MEKRAVAERTPGWQAHLNNTDVCERRRSPDLCDEGVEGG